MINNKKVVVIMPAYNAEKTLKQTYDEIYKDFVDEVILVDDHSQDNTKIVSKELNIKNGHENDLCGYVDGEWALDPKYIVGYISQDEGVCNFFTRAEIMYEYEKNKENHSTK